MDFCMYYDDHDGHCINPVHQDNSNEIKYCSSTRCDTSIRLPNIFYYIKSLDIDKMARFIVETGNGFNCDLCSEAELLRDNPLMKDERCSEDCEKHCREWLESAYWSDKE